MAKQATEATTMSRSFGKAGKQEAPVVTLRAATVCDVPSITEIFNQGVQDRTATMDQEHTVEQRKAWFLAHGATEPVIVAESGGQIAGWASLSAFNQRDCFDLVKELSIYVRHELRSKGVGDVMMQNLLERGKKAGLHKVVLFVFPSNQRAITLYRKHGFTKVGVFKSHGQREGEWLDSMAMERLLS